MQALQQRNTAQQQQLRLDALRHSRENHQRRARHCQEFILGAGRSRDLAHTILKAQLQSLHHALQVLKVHTCPLPQTPRPPLTLSGPLPLSVTCIASTHGGFPMCKWQGSCSEF